jgi:tetratricopeptide (TPR) repeat protein
MSQVKQLLDAAVRMRSTGRLRDAAQLCEQVLVMQPDHVDAMNLLAQVLQKAGQHGPAEKILRHALGKAPQHAASYVNLSSVLNSQGRFDEAVACAQEGMRRFPDNKLLANNLAVSLDAAGRYQEAVSFLQRRLKGHPKHAGGHYHLGILYRKLGRIEAAVEHLREAAKLEPRDLNALTAAADCWLRLRKPEEALVPLEAALRLSPYHVRALALKTVALAGAGKAQEQSWLADPYRLVHAVRLSELGYSADDIRAANARLSAFASSHPSMRVDPPDNATYNGRHSGNLAADEEPALQPLRALISHALKRRRETLDAEEAAHPFRRAVAPAFALHLWSVQLSSGGNMTPHIHTDGWLSGVYYVDVPEVVDDPAAGEAGWIRFGIPLPEHAMEPAPVVRSVKPEPGLMLTFPSYLWHATVPLPADTKARLCYSYDLQPRPAPVPPPFGVV